jgi:hypothetical protein
MSQSESQANALATSYTIKHVRLDSGERLLRRSAAWIMLLLLLSGELGSIWDREWHFFVGRDQFWTPPHTLIYVSIGGAGLVALAFVLVDTVRYLKGTPGVDDSSTISIFKVFHAPLGFIIAGFGALQALAAAPLDNYWHTLYGIDIALWAPFHMMGVTGGVIGGLGMVYIFASEAAIEREAGYPYRCFLRLSLLEWGALLVLAGLLNFTLIGFMQFPVATFGLLQIPSYPLPIAACGALTLIGAIRLTHKPGAATLTVLLLAFHTVTEELFVPWAIRTAVIQQDMSYRIPGQVPFFNAIDAWLPLIFIISALIVDGEALWRQRKGYKLGGYTRGVWLLGVVITLPQLIIAPCLLVGSLDLPGVFLEQPGVNILPNLKLETALIAVPIILAFGAFGAIAGANFGDIWRWNKR